MKSETVIFNGRKFRRYPESNRRHLRDYFWTSEIKKLKRSLSLHQEIWKFSNGDIPKGFEIHHKDRNPLNNDISNLECISHSEHKSKHRGYCSDKKREHLNNIRHLANAWHKTKECRELAKKNWDASLGKNFVERNYKCQRCGKGFVSTVFSKIPKWCSSKCKQANRYQSGATKINQNCIICGIVFLTEKYNPGKTCSFKCRGRLLSATPALRGGE